MIQIKELEKYCKSKLLDFEIFDDEILIIQEKEYQIVDDQTKLFDEDFEFLPRTQNDVDGFVYQFGGRWYLQEEGADVTMDELIYIGEANQKIPTKTFLGIHSGNELLNGVGLYKDWIKKAKFLGINTLGICERNSLAGVIAFQNECKRNQIKSIIGITVPIKGKSDEPYDVKIYAKNFEGWQNLLKFNSIINVQGEVYIEESLVYDNCEGLYIVLDPKTLSYASKPNFTKYYQLDTVRFDEEERDIDFINNLEKFLKSDLSPVNLCDAYYLESDDWEVREKLWGIAKSFDYKTKNQFFKNNDQFAKELIGLFDEDNRSWIKLFKEGAKNLQEIANSCSFSYDTTSRHLPKYIMTEEEAEQFDTNEELFMHLIKKGFKERNIKDKVYIDRLKEEIHVLKTGDVIDYFLTLHDIINFARREGILVGIGRGSAGGSLISYLLGIIQIDPLEFDLLFARFLNLGRMGEFAECEAYEIITDEGKVILNEKSLLKVIRNEKEVPIFIEDLQEGDEILKY